MRKAEICDVYCSIHVIWEIKGGVVRGTRWGGDRRRGKYLKK
jgi:hypothetical protein